MFAGLLSAAYLPFSVALGLLAGLLVLEVAALLLGGSLFGADAGPDVDLDIPTEFDLPAGAEPDVSALLAASDGGDVPDGASQAGAMNLLGLGRVPLAIWLATLLAGFGVGGVLVQGAAGSLFGAPLSPWLAVIPAAALGLAAARGLAGVLGNFVKPMETTATGPQFLGGLRGVVTQGTARRGSAAEVRLRDRHGNTHYQRCEPFRDTDVIPEGTEVLTLRERRPEGGWGLRILPLLTD